MKQTFFNNPGPAFAIALVVLTILGICFGDSVFDIKKPVLVKGEYVFEHTGRYYHKVKMPDGSTQEIKSLVPLTQKQWEERAVKAYVKPVEPEPTCEECHDRCGRETQ